MTNLPKSWEDRAQSVLARAGAVLLACGSLGLVAPAWAQAPRAAAADDATPDTSGDDSPRSTLARFAELARSGKYAEAARYLTLPTNDTARGPELAMRLRAVLDRHAFDDLANLSAATGGDTDDGLSAGVDEVAKVPGPLATTQSVRLVRRPGLDPPWVFSRLSVQRIDGWYGQLPHRWLLDLAPEPLLRMGPGALLWAQWLAVLPLLLLAWIGGSLLSRITRRLLAPIVQHTQTRWDDALLERIVRPLTLCWTLVMVYVMTPWLGLFAPALHAAQRSTRALLFATLFWGLARSVDVASQMLADSTWGHGAPATRAMLLFGSRVGKLMVAAMAIVALFSELGYPVASLLAGLGVGGIAVALAAQKTLENLLGAFAIAVDQPFREGDNVRVDGCIGTVESIGMRSTRIRTPERTQVNIPNGKLADMRIETFATRDRILLALNPGLTFGTTEAQLRLILSEFELVLRRQPKLWPDGVVVRFKELGEFALVLEVMAWFNTKDWNEFALIRQDVLLQFMAVVERVQASFAYPTRTVELAQRQVATAKA